MSSPLPIAISVGTPPQTSLVYPVPTTSAPKNSIINTPTRSLPVTSSLYIPIPTSTPILAFTPISKPTPLYISNENPFNVARTVFLIIGPVCLLVAVIYVILVLRSDRRRRRLEREDPESNNAGHSRINQEDDDLNPPPPQYQPYVDPGTLVLPETVYLHSNNITNMSYSQQRPGIVTITLTTTTTTVTPSDHPVPGSNPITTITPLPIAAHSDRRHNVTRGSNSTHHSASSFSEGTSGVSLLADFPEQDNLCAPASNGSNERSERHQTPGNGGNSRPGMLHPILCRFRSQGPPPYISMGSNAVVPQLPPDYNSSNH